MPKEVTETEYPEIYEEFSTHPTSEQRELLRVRDNRSRERMIVCDSGGASNGGYAYHEIDDDGAPLCGAAPGSLTTMTIKEAEWNQKSPCGRCERMLKLRGEWDSQMVDN